MRLRRALPLALALALAHGPQALATSAPSPEGCWQVAVGGPPRAPGVTPAARIRNLRQLASPTPRPAPTVVPMAWNPPTITPEELMAKRAAGDFWLLVDVRITGAYVQDRAAGAVSYPLELLFRDHPPPPPWPKGTKVALYCECPDESSSIGSARLLRELLNSEAGLYVLKGGLEAYMAAGYPVDEGAPTRPLTGQSPTPRPSQVAASPRASASPLPSQAPNPRPSASPTAVATPAPVATPTPVVTQAPLPTPAPVQPSPVSFSPSVAPSQAPTPGPSPSVDPWGQASPGWMDD